MVEPLRHRQTKGAATDMFGLQPLRHISTLPITDVASVRSGQTKHMEIANRKAARSNSGDPPS